MRARPSGPGHDRDLDDELEFHLEMQARSRDAARASAHGGSSARHGCGSGGWTRSRRRTAISAACPRSTRCCRTCGTPPRSLRRDSGFAGVALADAGDSASARPRPSSACCAECSSMPLPYPEPERLVRVYESNPRFPRRFRSRRHGLLVYRHENRTLTGIAGYAREDLAARDRQPAGAAARRCASRATTSTCSASARWWAGRSRGRRSARTRTSRSSAMPSGGGGSTPTAAVVGSAGRLSGKLVHDRRRDAAGFEHVGGSYRTIAPGRNRRCLVAAGAGSSQRAQGLALHQRGRPSQAGCDAGAGARRTGCGVGSHPAHPRTRWDIRVVSLARRRGRPVRRRHSCCS